MRHGYPTAESESPPWKEARRAAFVQEALATLTRRPVALLSFEEVSQKLALEHVTYLDLQEVPLDEIRGSVARYTDFTSAFLPRKDHLKSRWEGIEELARQGADLPPVELLKVGLVYFVRDGHHRVSVARQRGVTSIEAKVWEYDSPVALEPDSDVDELLCQAAHTAFMDRTGLEDLRPDVDIRLTVADGYAELLEDIEVYQLILTGVDRRRIELDEAVDLWCDLRYVPILGIIREQHVLADFPGRTETDLFLWLCRNQQELEANYQQPVLMDEAADDLSKRYGQNPLPTRHIRRAGGWLAAAARRVARRPGAMRGFKRRREGRDDDSDSGRSAT
jgi:hypothetical protein